MKNPLIGSQYFKENPEKVLGTESLGGQYGTTLIVTGNPQEALDKIDAKSIEEVEYDLDTLSSLSNDTIDDIVKEVKSKTTNTKQSRERKKRTRKKSNNTDNVVQIIANAEKEASKNVWSVRDIVDSKYNEHISRQELEAFLYAHPELPKDNYIDKFQYKLSELIDLGLLYYDRNQVIEDFSSVGIYEEVTESAGRFCYKYEYLSGDTGKKLSNLKRAEEEYKEKLGELNFINQKEALIKCQPKKKLIGDIDDPNRLILRFDSEFCRFFTINATTKQELSTPTTLYDFLKQSTHDQEVIPNSLFHKCTRHEYGSLYVLDGKIKVPDGLSKQAEDAFKMGVKSRIEKDGERIFNYILNNSLLSEDKARIAMLWNEKYNSIVSYDSIIDSKITRNEEGEEVVDNVSILDKIPVAFSFSKSFKDGSRPLELTRTQKNGISYSIITGSNCIAFDVGVGKTLCSIALVSQYVESNKSKFPLFVVPNNVFYKWASEFQGEWDGQKGEYVLGALPHFPKLRLLHNLNKEVLLEHKIYTDDELDEISEFEAGIEIQKDLIKPIKEAKSYTALNELKLAMTNPDLSEIIELFTEEKLNTRTYKNAFGKGADKVTEATYEKLCVAICEAVLKRLSQQQKYLYYYRGTWKEVPENTITLLTYEGLDKLGTEDYEAVTQDCYKVLEQGDEHSADREATANYDKVKNMLEPSAHTPTVMMEELGIDWICYDEAHMVKKFFTSVKGAPKLGANGEIEREASGNAKREKSGANYSLSSGTPSKKAIRAFCVNRVIQRKSPQNNVFFLTATPFENNPLEIYSMLSLMNQERLDQYGYARIKTFFDNFMKLDFEIKVSATGGIKKAQVLTGFNNLAQFRLIIRSMINYVTGEQANVPRPNKIMLPSDKYGINTTLEPTALQTDLLNKIQAYIFSPPKKKKGEGQSDEPEEEEITLQSICAGVIEEDLQQATENIISNVDEMGFDEILEYLEGKKNELESEGEPVTGIEKRISDLSKRYEEYEDEPSNDKRKDAWYKIINTEKDKVAKAVLAENKKSSIDENELADNDKKAVKIMQGLTWMRMIALSPYLFTCYKEAGIEPTAKEYIETSPKLKYVMDCIKSIHEWHKTNGTKEAGQVIYMNAGVNVKGWSQGGFEKIAQYLVDEIGFKKEEVVSVKGGMTAKRKELAKEKFLKGEAKILIGSKAIEVGVDLQKNGAILYNCFFDWNPTNATQVAGRIHRQGNRFNNVRIVYPLVENSADAIMFQYLYEKTMRLKEIWDVEGVKSQLDLRDFDPNKLKLQLITDPFKRATMEIIVASEAIEEDIIYYSNKQDSISDIPMIVNEYKKLRGLLPQYLLGWKTVLEQSNLNFDSKSIVTEISNVKREISDAVMEGDMKKVETIKEKITKLEKKQKMLQNDYDSVMEEFKAKLNNNNQFDTDKEHSTFLFTQCGRLIKSTESLGYSATDEARERSNFFITTIRDIVDSDSITDEFEYMKEYGWRRTATQLMNQFRGSHGMYWQGMKTWESLDIDVDAIGESIKKFVAKIDALRKQKEELNDTIPERVERIKLEIAKEKSNRGTYTQSLNQFAGQNDWLLSEMYPVKVVEVEEVVESEVEIVQDQLETSIMNIGDTITLPSGLVLEFFKNDNEGYHFYELTKSGRYKKRGGTPVAMTISEAEVMNLRGEDLEPRQQAIETAIDSSDSKTNEYAFSISGSDGKIYYGKKVKGKNLYTAWVEGGDRIEEGMNASKDDFKAFIENYIDSKQRDLLGDEMIVPIDNEYLFANMVNYPDRFPKVIHDTAVEMSEKYDDGTLDYPDLKKYKETFEANGYTFDYGLDTEPFGFARIPEGTKGHIPNDELFNFEMKELDEFMQPLVKEEFASNKDMEVYIDYMDKDNNFKTSRKYFKTYDEAEKWAKSDFEKYDPDFISYNPEFEETTGDDDMTAITDKIEGFEMLLDVLEGEELQILQDKIEGYKLLTEF